MFIVCRINYSKIPQLRSPFVPRKSGLTSGLNCEIEDRCFIHEFYNEIYRYLFVKVALKTTYKHVYSIS